MKAKLLIDGKEIEINISEEEYRKLQSPKEKKTGYERVEVGEEFYYVSASSKVELGDDDYVSIDNEYYDIGNYYSSKIVAKNNARAEKLMRQLRRFAVEHRDSKIDWNDHMSMKFYIVYNPANSDLRVGQGCMLCYFGDIYFDSEIIAQDAINKFHDELIWYFTEYKDSL